jgi:FkbM family methyltransferase
MTQNEVIESTQPIGLTIKIILYSVLELTFRNFTYTVNSGIARGLKRKGGLGFIPRRLTSEEIFLLNYNFKEKTVYDIGAHVGMYTIFFAKSAGSNGKVYTFEPNPDNYSKIIDNTNINGLKNVNIIKSAIGKNHLKSQLIVRHGDSGTGTLEKTIQEQIINEKNYKAIEIDVDSIDNLINNNNILHKPDFVKIDVEGLELAVLEGMEKTIQKYHPDLFIEIHGSSMNLKKMNVASVFSILDSYNYKIYHVESGRDILKNNLSDACEGHIFCTNEIIHDNPGNLGNNAT